MPAAIILAGGLGTRLRSVVPDVPKPMAPINGTPFLQLQLDYWIAQGIHEFVMSVGYRHETIINYFGNSYRSASIKYAIEEEPLGTGGGLLLAMERVREDGPVLLINGDTYFGVLAQKLIAFHTTNNADLTFSLFRAHEDARYGGVMTDSAGRVTDITPRKAAAGELANGGVYALRAGAFRNLRAQFPRKASFEDEIMPVLLNGGARFFGLPCEGQFIDIGIPADYYRAATLVEGPSKC